MKKILCLHGSHQNKEIFRTKLGRIPHKLKNHFQLTIIDGPIICPPDIIKKDEETEEAEEKKVEEEVIKRAWFKRIDNSDLLDTDSIESAMNYIEEVWNSDGPFDGVLGFSMGGTMGALLCQPSVISRYSSLKFLICIGAPDIPLFDKEGVVDIPSLHIAGETDTNVVIERSVNLSKRFPTSTFMSHPMGHCIPMKAENLNWITNFVNNFK